MYCPKCNNYIPVDFSKCPNCGYRPAPDSISKDTVNDETVEFGPDIKKLESDLADKTVSEKSAEATMDLENGLVGESVSEKSAEATMDLENGLAGENVSGEPAENSWDATVELPVELETRKCPFCAEQIKVDAIICRFCRMDLKTGKSVDYYVRSKGGVSKGFKYGCITILAFVILALVLFFLMLKGCRSNLIVSPNGGFYKFPL